MGPNVPQPHLELVGHAMAHSGALRSVQNCLVAKPPPIDSALVKVSSKQARALVRLHEEDASYMIPTLHHVPWLEEDATYMTRTRAPHDAHRGTTFPGSLDPRGLCDHGLGQVHLGPHPQMPKAPVLTKQPCFLRKLVSRITS